MQLISTVLSNVDVIILVGTRIKAPSGVTYVLTKLEWHWAISAGWTQAPFTNRSAGVTIMISNRIPRSVLF